MSTSCRSQGGMGVENLRGLVTPPPPLPPISELHDDILHDIFSLNSHANIYQIHNFNWNRRTKYTTEPDETWQESDAALIVNRRTSQVCRRWRLIILSSPYIWANSLDLNFLNQKEDHWREEVVRRTGQALLTLVGTLGSPSRFGSWDYSVDTPYSTPFALVLLDTQWNRVRSLAIYLDGTEIVGKIHAILQRPAPNLEHFVHIHLSRWDDPIELATADTVQSTMIFSDRSPRLRSFFCTGVKYHLAGEWLSNIRCLELTLNETSFTVVDLLQGVQLMPLLEALFIDSYFDYTGNAGLSVRKLPTMTVSLPRLSNLAITGTMKATTKLLENILPAVSGCNLAVDSYNTDNITQFTRDIERGTSTYSSFFRRNNSNLSHATDISISVERGLVSVDIFGSPLLSSISLKYNGTGHFSWSCGALLSIINALSLCDLSRVTTLTLVLDHAIRTDPMNPESDVADLHDFFKALPSIEELKCNSEIFQFLVGAQNNSSSILLPKLVTVDLTGKLWPMSSSFTRFLVRRIVGGAPIGTLKMPPHRQDDTQRFWYLDGIDGLSVVWNEVLDRPGRERLPAHERVWG